MYVCLCKGVTDSAIRHAVQSGVSDYPSLRRTTGLGSQCGRCACHARELLTHLSGEQPTADPELFHPLPALA